MYLLYGQCNGERVAAYGWSLGGLLYSLCDNYSDFVIEEKYIVWLPIDKTKWEKGA